MTICLDVHFFSVVTYVMLDSSRCDFCFRKFIYCRFMVTLTILVLGRHKWMESNTTKLHDCVDVD